MSPAAQPTPQDTTPLAGNRIARAVRAAAAEIFGARSRELSTTAQADAAVETKAIVRRSVSRSSYAGAETTRFNLDWRAGTSAPDTDLAGAAAVLRGRGRDLARNNPYVVRFLDLLAANVLGPDGIGHQAQVRFTSEQAAAAQGKKVGDLDEVTNDYIEAGWREYCASAVTVDGRLNFLEYSTLQLTTAATDGEAFTRRFIGSEFRHGLGLQPIDPDLVPTNISRLADASGSEVRLGVEVDRIGRRLAYHVFDLPQYTPGAYLRPPERVSAREMLHHYRALRAHQTRGVTWLAPIMADIQDLAGYDEAVILGARAGANQMAFVQWKHPELAGVAPTDEDGARRPLNVELNPATVTELDPGQEAVPFDPSQPSGVYADFTKAVLRRLACGLKMSYSSLTGDLREVSYSGHKVGQMTEQDMYKMIQRWWISAFQQPIYEMWLQTATLTGALNLPNPDWRAYSAVAWSPRRWKWTEPQREITAVKEQIALGLTSRQRVNAEQSDGDYRKILEELAQEKQAAAEAGVNIGGTSQTAAASTGGTIEDPPADPNAEDAADGGDAAARSVAPVNRISALTNGHAKH